MFSATISLKSLSQISRSLATMLKSGVSLLKSIQTISKRVGTPDCKKRMKAVAQQIAQGTDVRTAFLSQGDYFPDLFVDMISVAEDTGTLPEVLLSLANHYENLVALKRSFIAQITMPIVQLVASFCIITFVIFILGTIANRSGTKPIDVLGWGLNGERGAAIFFFGSFGSLFAVFLIYKFVARGLKQERRLHGLFLKVPVLGSCMRSFAIARFSWAFALTQQAGMRIVPSLEASLKATANHAFIGAAPRMCGLINQGEDLSTVLYDSGLFPVEFLEMVQVAETSGTVPEMLEHMSPQFEDQARRSLANLAAALGWLVWGLVAAFIIFVIFTLALFYVSMLNDPFKNL